MERAKEESCARMLCISMVGSGRGGGEDIVWVIWPREDGYNDLEGDVLMMWEGALESRDREAGARHVVRKGLWLMLLSCHGPKFL